MIQSHKIRFDVLIINTSIYYNVTINGYIRDIIYNQVPIQLND